VGSMLLIVAAKVVRASCLFYLNTGLISMPDGAHDAVGLVVFAATTAAMMLGMSAAAPTGTAGRVHRSIEADTRGGTAGPWWAITIAERSLSAAL